MQKTIALLALLLCLCANNLMAAVIYVDSSNTGGFQDGTSWATAFINPQSAINIAVTGDSVWLAKGTYQPVINTSFSMKEGVKILGGFLKTYTNIGQRNWQDNITVLKGNNTIVINNNGNNLTFAAVLDGVRITCNGAFNPSNTGMYNMNASPSISNCIFMNNRGTNGGAIYNNGSSPSIENCTFSYNTAENGAGIYNDHSSPLIMDCQFTGNSSYSFGGGMYNANSSPTLINCAFSTNSAVGSSSVNSGRGGGIYNTASSPNIINTSFIGNTTGSTLFSSGKDGGGICNLNASTPSIITCLFSNNKANFGTGSSIYNGSSSAIINDCTFADSIEGSLSNDGSAPNITGCTFLRVIMNNGEFSNPVISGCTFLKTAMFNSGTAVPNVTLCHFEGYTGFGMINSGASPIVSYSSFTGNAGGIYNSNSSAKITSCTFTGNYGPGMNNAASTPVVTNCIFSRNTTVHKGAGMNNVGSAPRVVNCVFSGNVADSGGGGMSNTSNSVPRISNTILWGNNSGMYNDQTSNVSSGYSLIQGFVANTANHNLDGATNPLFVDAANNNYHLLPGSPCINNGNNDSVPSGIILDLAATPRINGGTVDMGAYEFVTNAPIITLGNDTALCSGNTVTLNAQNPGSLYFWNTGAGTQTITVNASGTYSVMVVNNFGTAADSVQVTFKAAPVVHLGNDTTFCMGHHITLNAQRPAATYAWSNAAITPVIDVNATGTYSVAVTDTNTCTGYDTIQVTVNPMPIVDLGNDTGICAGSNLILDALNAGDTYSWNNASATTQTFSVNTAGSYYVTVSDASHCTGSDTIQVSINPLPVVVLGNDITLTQGNSITLDAGNTGASFNWNTGATTQTITVNNGGTYTVAVTNTNGCTGSDTINVTGGNNVGIHSVAPDKAALTISPNPATDILTISLINTKLLHTRVILTDATGHSMQKIKMESNVLHLSLSGYTPGLYILKMEDGSSYKFVKE